MHNGLSCNIGDWQAVCRRRSGQMLHLMPNSTGKTEKYYFVLEPLILFNVTIPETNHGPVLL